MEYALVGDPGSGATLRLDYRAFAYAGKFVVGKPGKAVLRTPDGSPAVPRWEPEEPLPPTVEASAFDDDVVAAVSFSPDRTDPACCRLRYVTVHVARRGEGIGPRLVDRTVSRLAADGYDRVRIAVNNPFAYAALYKSGFAYTGDRTGLAELELERPATEPAPESDGDGERYRAGLRAFREDDRELDPRERRFIAERLGEEPESG
ncbi:MULTISPECIES: GNAT family N-acetyltransferase [unclassified Halorubrum]|uniref:GNAT family N-acetyltransferase n=1 Tax=unclassified Halorubrum TaxID=2642239 RepID=UPI000B9941B9|nr:MULTISPECIES: GNAT family N-acetyltransferase [unclassified Halorubrum]OYR45414.1 GNAT family N-acetyltransferase [Halorubrum sp. Hd13]OYR49614.1 GNAT family N-acetyltransferase [Halorubrum sp. Eb13]OYR51086.1 GNAT family N-acetyltransferase [Halorubrum sp. Ea1]